tara:strand:+ start:724 stop:2082 length:1359 start_codon:yes stop_codon:yes gene_type:complete
MNLQIKLVCCLTLLSFVLTQGALDQYDIPEYEYRTLQLNGDDLLFYQSADGNDSLSMSLGADFMSTFQSPGYNLSYGLTFAFESNSAQGDTTNWMINAPFSVDKYFTDNKGIFGFADGSFVMEGGDKYSDGFSEDDASDLNLTIGAGYGRIVSAKPVAQAYAIADALGIDSDDDTILAIAEVIGAASSYGSIYKDDATQQYYNDLAEAAGVDGSAMQIQKVLTSPAYNVSDRFTGCDVRVGITNNYMQADGEEDAGYMMMEANYAMPMGMDSQLMANFGYTMDLNENKVGKYSNNWVALEENWADLISISDDEDDCDHEEEGGDDGGGDDDGEDDHDHEEEDHEHGEDDNDRDIMGGWTGMSLGATYTMDHSYNWSTSAGVNYITQAYTEIKAGNAIDHNESVMILSVSSTMAVLSQMSVTASFTHIMPMGDLEDTIDPITEFSTKVTYWVF